ncbi:MAG: diguanylate cyclase [Solobacterium sp.]|nr:diguanylate cyclase [Solobacterium sp.]
MKQNYKPETHGCAAVRALMNIRWKKAVFLLISLFLILLNFEPMPVYAERDVVRIGFFNSDHYGYIGLEGDLRGYDVQLSKTIGMYGGFKAEMIGFDSVLEMEDALRDGDVDALIDFVKTDKREEEFIFTDNYILQEQISLYTNDDSESLNSHDLAEAEHLIIGSVSDAGYLDYFIEYCDELGINPEFMSFSTESLMNAALEQGLIQAGVTGSAVPNGCRVLLTTPPLNSYIMLRAQDVALKERIDSAINQLKIDDPSYYSSLSNHYIVSNDNEMAPLSAQERAYLLSHPELTVAVIRGAEPFTVENEDGSLGGIIPEYYRALGDLLGVSFQFVVFDGTQDAINAVTEGTVDILGHYYGDIIIADSENLYNTMTYGSAECGRLVRSGSSTVSTVAATTRTIYLLSEQLEPDIQLVAYPNVEACYQALMHNEVDAMIGSMISISWLINQHTMRGVNLSILPEVTVGVRGAVSCDNTTLLFILNKAISVSRNEMEEAIVENAVNGKIDLRTTLENLPVGYTIGALSILALLVFFLIVSIILLVRSNRARVALLNREMNVDGLTGASSRRFGTELLMRELSLFQRYGEGPMLAMFDIDHFKEKNDTFGHEYGDFVLKHAVDVLRGTLRKSDTIIRWGGDEFILICPKVRRDGAESLLEKIVNTISHSEFLMDGKGEKITVSIGASFFSKDDEDVMSVLRRCDSALYHAKTIRDSYCVYSDESGE